MKTEEQDRIYTKFYGLERGKTWAEIDLGALRENYRMLKKQVRERSPDARALAVVKAEAYGHGAEACVRALLDEGCDLFGVSCIEEAAQVRDICDEVGRAAEVIIFGYTDPRSCAELAARRLTQALLSEDYARRLSACAVESGVTVSVHAAVDTGMNRIGIVAQAEDELTAAADAILRIHALPGLQLTGAFTHFSRADEDLDGEGGRTTARQSERFHRVMRAVQERGLTLPLCHACNSAAALRRPEDHWDAVRFGIALYGIPPAADIRLPLRPVMKLCTVISHLHTVRPGEQVGYGGTYTATREQTVATLPIGYADGFLRAYRGAAVTLQTDRGRFSVPLIGNICMDQCVIDVTDTGARVGDTVTLFGATPDDIRGLARRARTIEYEVLTAVSARVPRVYVM